MQAGIIFVFDSNYCFQIEGLVMVDLDRGQVQICDTVKTVPSIPKRVAEEFNEK